MPKAKQMAMTAFRMWMALASMAEKAKLAKLSNVSRTYFYQASNPDKRYGRKMSIDTAVAIEQAAAQIRASSPEAARRLPELLRVDLHPECGRCVYARKCLGDQRMAIAAFNFEAAPAKDTKRKTA